MNWDKVFQPSQKMIFLGIEIDCVSRTISLPKDKLCELRTLLTLWSLKRKCTKRHLQILIGKLNWCVKVVRGGRTFLRNLIDLLTKVKSPHHYIRLSMRAKSDINWWIVGLSKFHGYTPFTCDQPIPSYAFATDSCLQGGAGHFCSDWFYSSWATDYPDLDTSNINILELFSVLLAARRWGHLWVGHHILVRSDNTATVAAINKSTSRSPGMLYLVKQIFWLSVEHDFILSARYLPGKLNVLSDSISRMHDPYFAHSANLLMGGLPGHMLYCSGHMSDQSFLSLQMQWRANSNLSGLMFTPIRDQHMPYQPKRRIEARSRNSSNSA